MTNSTYRFEFDRGTDLDDAESTLHLAILAAEGLYSEAQIRLGFAYHRDEANHCLHLSGGDDLSATVVHIFTALATKEFGATAFAFTRVDCGEPAEPMALAT